MRFLLDVNASGALKILLMDMGYYSQYLESRAIVIAGEKKIRIRPQVH
ncbi:hypothetical protein ACN4EE_22465 [Geminocystis sp. CENA526]